VQTIELGSGGVRHRRYRCGGASVDEGVAVTSGGGEAVALPIAGSAPLRSD
jgi:hypothetical protein